MKYATIVMKIPIKSEIEIIFNACVRSLASDSLSWIDCIDPSDPKLNTPFIPNAKQNFKYAWTKPAAENVAGMIKKNLHAGLSPILIKKTSSAMVITSPVHPTIFR